MSSGVSRRWFVGGVGAAAAASLLVWRGRRADYARSAAHQRDLPIRYIDRDGWILTPKDQQRLMQRASGAPVK